MIHSLHQIIRNQSETASQAGVFRSASVFPGYLTGKIAKLRIYEDKQAEYTMGSNVRVAIIEDDEDVRDMLERVFKSTEGLTLTGSWPSMEAALKPVKMHRPDVVLLDIGLPGMSGLEGAAELIKVLPQVKILMLTGRDAREDIFAALRAGASGYVTKGTSQAEIVKAVLSVSEGNAALSPEVARTVVEVFRPNPQQYELTRRELEILAQLCNGASYKEIASSLFVEQSTVHFHLKNIYRKLDVRSKGEAIAKALQEKLVSAL